MINGYFIKRTEKLNVRLTEYKNKYEHNLIAIKEANNKIDKLKGSIDEASNIFSVKARENNSFKQQEIANLETKIAAYVIENNEYKEIIDKTDRELAEISECQKELFEIKKKVSRETFFVNSGLNTYDNICVEDHNIIDNENNKQLEINIEGLNNNSNNIYSEENIIDNKYESAVTSKYNRNVDKYDYKTDYTIMDDSDMKVVVDGITTDKKTADIINKLKICK